VVALALVAAVVKSFIAVSTKGTADVETFRGFARAIRAQGPIDVYSDPTPALAHYNHPPLAGWMLVGLNWLNTHGLSFATAIRGPAILADIVTTVLVFELVRRHRSLRQATIAGALVAFSPVLIIISGYHGNTDAVFVMLAMASFFLLVTNRSGLLAGMAFAAAVSVKLVPVVLLPLLILVAVRAGRRRAWGFLIGGAALFAVVWGPVLLRQWPAFDHKVLQYGGWGWPWWGVPELVFFAGAPQSWVEFLVGTGRFIALVLSAGAPLALAWRRPGATIPAFGLCLAMFLLLSTASATQYLAWAAAAVFLVTVWGGALYNATAGAFLVIIYSHWNDAPFWRWDRAYTQPITIPEAIMGEVVWATLLVVVVVGFWPHRGRASPDDDREDRDHEGTAGERLTATPSAASSSAGATGG
jgi:hypothetical protein